MNQVKLLLKAIYSQTSPPTHTDYLFSCYESADQGRDEISKAPE